MTNEHKIYASLAVLALLGGGVYMQRQKARAVAAAHSPTAIQAELPAIAPGKDDVEKITKIEIKNADKSDVTLEKQGEEWQVTRPVAAKASAQNVRSLLDNLKELKVKDVIDRGSGTYDQYDLTDEKGLHLVAYKGDEKLVDLYFGKSGSRGQMARVGGRDGVFIASGYSSYLYGREVKNWREMGVLKFEDANVVAVDVKNRHGEFAFTKASDDKWSATFKGKKGAKGKLSRFDENKLKDLLRAYKSLNAEDFGDGTSDTGFSDPEGRLRIKLKDDAGEHVIVVGKVSKGSSRFARKEGDETVYVLSSWSADWVTSDEKKFQKVEEKKDDKKEPEPDLHAHDE